MTSESKKSDEHPNIVVVGACNVDLISYVDRLPEVGETIKGRVFKKGFGGKGANQAVMASKCGAHVFMVSKENFKRHHVDTKYIFRSKDPSISSGLAPITVDNSGHNTIVIIGGANDLLTKEEIALTTPIISSAAYLLAQLELPMDITLEAMRIARKHNIPILFNPAPAQPHLSVELLHLSDIIVPNETELGILTGLSVKTLKEVEIASKELVKNDCKNVLVTLGAQGCLLVNKDTVFHAPVNIPKKFQSVDTSGAGDCFLGALAYCLARNVPLERAMVISNDAATFSVARMGTQSSYPNRVELQAMHNIFKNK